MINDSEVLLPFVEPFLIWRSASLPQENKTRLRNWNPAVMIFKYKSLILFSPLGTSKLSLGLPRCCHCDRLQEKGWVWFDLSNFKLQSGLNLSLLSITGNVFTRVLLNCLPPVSKQLLARIHRWGDYTNKNAGAATAIILFFLPHWSIWLH